MIFHADDQMTMVEMGGFVTVRKLNGTDNMHRGIGELFFSPTFLAVAYTDKYQADCALER